MKTNCKNLFHRLSFIYEVGSGSEGGACEIPDCPEKFPEGSELTQEEQRANVEYDKQEAVRKREELKEKIELKKKLNSELPDIAGKHFPGNLETQRDGGKITILKNGKPLGAIEVVMDDSDQVPTFEVRMGDSGFNTADIETLENYLREKGKSIALEDLAANGVGGLSVHPESRGILWNENLYGRGYVFVDSDYNSKAFVTFPDNLYHPGQDAVYTVYTDLPGHPTDADWSTGTKRTYQTIEEVKNALENL